MAHFSYETIHFSFTENELWEVAVALRHKLESRLSDKHYDKYPASWQHNNGATMSLFSTVCLSIGRAQMFNEFEAKVKERFEEPTPCKNEQKTT
jgi:hypothetical protein